MLSRILTFILSPFAGPIRYGTLKLMKAMRQPDDRRPIIATSDHILNELVLPSIFQTFKKGEFRNLANFKKLPVVEHDRIFNELEVAGVYLAIFCLRLMKPLVRSEDYHFWQDVEFHLPKQLQKILINYGVDGASAKLLKELTEMRGDEYEELAEKVLEVNDGEKEEFKNLPSELKDMAAFIQATAVVTTDHIRRGKINQGDSLIKYLVKWLVFLQARIAKFVRNL